MILQINRSPDFLKGLTCHCGKPAVLGWHLPVDKSIKKKKLSKTDIEDEIPPEKRKPQPYGWSCSNHIPVSNSLNPEYLWVE